jgi:hypothetical protein
MKTLLLTFIVALVVATSVPVLSQNKNTGEKMIQGTWHLEGGGENKTPRWFLEWTFKDGKFNLDGYPPLHQEGSYRVVKTKGDKLTLELFDQKGNFGTEKSQMEVVLDKKQDMLTIKDKGPFTRVYKKGNSY